MFILVMFLMTLSDYYNSSLLITDMFISDILHNSALHYWLFIAYLAEGRGYHVEND